MDKDTQMEEVKVAIEETQELFKKNKTKIDRAPTLIDIEPEEIIEIENLVRKAILENCEYRGKGNMIRKGQIEGIKKGNVKDQVEFIVNLFQIAA